MEVFEAIRNRRSVRSFKKAEVSDEDLARLIEAASCAPSAGNIQPWEFIVVRDPQLRHELSVAALEQSFIEEAPVAVVVCADQARSEKGYGSRGKDLYCIQDTAAAIENLLLGAYAMGFGACWVGAFEEELVRKAVKTPKHVKPVAIVPIGYASQTPRTRRRRSVSEIIHKEVF
ncbi:MAG: nitroreductase family protein [Candidatus Bathyarchaeota archaeon]|nr:nitroreductase family protein [Candidatus Bathyarchaeota archaeon]